ncbi:MAG: hypothetical protein COU65_00760 [Candidatus Pacebacteria bacterium CG10_big_fil_rev_8_21_14_0_10_42_12]|nr:VanZ family protein [Candidatus Paceibacterota bacterium]PIR62962.1 MAG: hypothetical protein COU65_00760 [Candidatus Pacebacteria bacterium CG10_big_fil_rev_8_21_14_0_10_42_12]
MKLLNKNLIFVTAYAPVIIWAVAIFVVSGQQVIPGFSLQTTDFLFKKAGHMTAYAIMYLLLFRAQRITRPQDTSYRVWLLPLIFTVLYAVSDELHQSFVSGRHGTLRDVGFDSLGAAIAFLKLYKYL